MGITEGSRSLSRSSGMAHTGLEQSPIPLASNRLRILQIGHDLPHLRMSADISQYRRGRDIDALLRCADCAIYEAKSRRRDDIVTTDGDHVTPR